MRKIFGNVTLAGRFLLIVCALCLPLALFWGWQVASTIVILGLAIAMLALIMVIGRRDYQVTLNNAQNHLTVGSKCQVTLTVKCKNKHFSLSSKVLFTCYSTQSSSQDRNSKIFKVPFLKAEAENSIIMEFPTQKRAKYFCNVQTLRADPFGILAITKQCAPEFTVFVHPKTAPLKVSNALKYRSLNGNASEKFAEIDYDFHTLREYSPGDSPKAIHWKSTAKLGKLHTKQFNESQEAKAKFVLSLSAHDYADANEFELGVEVFASLYAAYSKAMALTGIEFLAGNSRSAVSSMSKAGARESNYFFDEITTLSLNQFEKVLAFRKLVRYDEQITYITGSKIPLNKQISALRSQHSHSQITLVRINPLENPNTKRLGNLSVISVGTLAEFATLYNALSA